MLLADHNRLTALDKDGIRWRSSRLVGDELAMVSVDRGIALVRGWDPALGANVTARVAIDTGLVISH
ncbi:MAG: hypothetical protein ABI824_12780 [Acidobacteriota bacterium]